MRTVYITLLLLALGISAAAQQRLTPGNPAPDFSAQSLDGDQINLAQMQGKVIVLTFWSTRCQICHAEIPKLNQIVDRYRGQDVVFLALTMENDVKVHPYLKKNPFNFEILPNSFGVVMKYADLDQGGRINMGFPAYFLINKQGTIELKANGWDKSSNLDAQISRLLAAE